MLTGDCESAALNQKYLPWGTYRLFVFRPSSNKPDVSFVEPAWAPAALERLLGITQNRICWDWCDQADPDAHVRETRLKIFFHPEFRRNGQKPNRSLSHTVKAGGLPVQNDWRGTIVIGAFTQITDEPTDVTMADLTTAVRSLYTDVAHLDSQQQALRATFGRNRFPEIQGVGIPADVYTQPEHQVLLPLTVSEDAEIRGHFGRLVGTVSQISKKIGVPLRVLRVSWSEDASATPSPDILSPTWVNMGVREEEQVVPDEDELTRPLCSPVLALMRIIDSYETKDQGMMYGHTPMEWTDTSRAVVVRDDDKDITVAEVRAMVYFIEEKWSPLRTRAV